MIDELALAREVGRTMSLKRAPVLRFLAQGEYSHNDVTVDTADPLVVRCVTGSQIGFELPRRQRLPPFSRATSRPAQSWISSR